MYDIENVTLYNEDVILLKSLGLPVWSSKLFEEVFLGEVCPYKDFEEEGEITLIKIFVTGCPAQFFRFEIIRKADSKDATGMEYIQVNTGSGTLSQYWPMVLAVAGNMFSVGVATKLPEVSMA